MIEAINLGQNFFQSTLNLNIFNDFIPRFIDTDLISGGAGNEKPPIEETKSDEAIFIPGIKESSEFICDKVIGYDLEKGIGSFHDIGREVLKTAYSSARNLNYSKLMLAANYIIVSKTQSLPQPQNILLSKQSITSLTQTSNVYPTVIAYHHPTIIPVVQYTTATQYNNFAVKTYHESSYSYHGYTFGRLDLGYNSSYQPLPQPSPDIKTLYSPLSVKRLKIPVIQEIKTEYNPGYSVKPRLEVRNYTLFRPKTDILYRSSDDHDTSLSVSNLQETELKVSAINDKKVQSLEKILGSTPNPHIDTSNHVLDYHLSKLLVNTENRADDYTANKSETLDSKPALQTQEKVNYSEKSNVMILLNRRKPEENKINKSKKLEQKIKARVYDFPKPQQEKRRYNEENLRYSKNCRDTSSCFAQIVDWMDGKKVNLSEEKLKSLSQCYVSDIHKIRKAREYLKTRNDGFDELTLKRMQNSRYRLTDLQEAGFYLAEQIKVTESSSQNYTILAENVKTKKLEKVNVSSNSVYAEVDKHLKKKSLHGVFRVDSYIDTDTGKERHGMYLKTIAEYHLEAQKLLGGKDKYGMNLNGIIILVNGKEPGKGTTALDPLHIKRNDILSIIYKNDAAMYKSNGPSLKKAA